MKSEDSMVSNKDRQSPGVDEYIHRKVVYDTGGIINQWGNSSVNSNWIPTHKSQIHDLNVKGSPPVPAVQYQKAII